MEKNPDLTPAQAQSAWEKDLNNAMTKQSQIDRYNYQKSLAEKQILKDYPELNRQHSTYNEELNKIYNGAVKDLLHEQKDDVSGRAMSGNSPSDIASYITEAYNAGKSAGTDAGYQKGINEQKAINSQPNTGMPEGAMSTAAATSNPAGEGVPQFSTHMTYEQLMEMGVAPKTPA